MKPVAVIGHISIDRIITNEGERYQLGGPPTYFSLVTNLLGAPLRAATKVGGDFTEEYVSELRSRGLDVHGSIDNLSRTTRFVLDYTVAERGLGYESICSLIEPRDIEELREAAVIDPIVGEIPKETLEALESQVLALDPQGFVRRLESNGSISLRPWIDLDLLRRLSVFKASARELRFVAGEAGWAGLERISRLGVDIAIETHGEEGAKVLNNRRKIMVPAYKGDTFDVTGAGDAFIAGFFSEYASGELVEWCSAVGAAAASTIVETIGPNIKVRRGELLERAEKIYSEITYL